MVPPPDADDGVAAKEALGIAPLLTDAVNPAPKLAIPSTRYPQVFAVNATGLAGVPLMLAIVLPLGPSSVVDVLLLLMVTRYPVLESVVAVTVLLCTEQRVEPPDGVTLTFTVAPDASVKLHVS